jgi:hypothetical protein
MKSTFIILSIAILISCQNKIQDMPIKEMEIVKKGTMKIILDGKTYNYNDINWKKSRINYDNDKIRLSIRQDDFPQLMFSFPYVKKSLVNGQGFFKIPDIHRRVSAPITLNFIVRTTNDKNSKKSEAVTLRQGQIKISLNNNKLEVEFEGEGGPTLRSSITYAISGTINMNL